MRYKILRVLLLAISIAFGLMACSEEGSTGASWYAQHTLYAYDASQGNFWNRIRANMHMPLYTYTPAVKRQISWYQHHPQYLNHVVAESAPYIYYIYQQTQQRRLPAELALIPVIESDYNPYSRSKVGAEGLWQMMPSTARGFGLKHDNWYNGSRDIVASTHAALMYFAYLHALFHGNWLLAIASYDCGEGRVMAAMRYNQLHHRSGDFWNLPLPSETQQYVPSLLAVAAIVKNPGHYGLTLPPINDAPYIEQVTLDKQMSLSKAAQLAEVPVTTIKVLNPALQHDTTDPRGPYTLLIPTNKADTFREKLAALTATGKQKIATMEQKYQTNVTQLRQAITNKEKQLDANSNTNNVAPNVATAPTAENPILPNPNKLAADATDATDTAANSAGSTAALPINYEVQNGDDLHKIAHKFHTTTTVLRKANKLTSNRIKVGQSLVIPANNITPTPAATSADKIYIVKKGDYLEKIAKRVHVSVDDLKKWNPDYSDKTLQPGQKLATQPPESAVASNDE